MIAIIKQVMEVWGGGIAVIISSQGLLKAEPRPEFLISKQRLEEQEKGHSDSLVYSSGDVT